MYSLISDWLVEIESSINKDSMEFLLLLELDIVWKKFVHLSPSLSHKIQDFCLQLTSSMRMDLSKALTIYAFFILSSTPNALPSSMTLRTHNSSKRIFFLSTLPNTSSFHLFRSTFKALSLLAKMKLGVPWKR
jgi:hypothetical protein